MLCQCTLHSLQCLRRSNLYVRCGRALMWRRSDNICFALLLSGGEGVTVGERVECKVKGILQVPHMRLFKSEPAPATV